MNERHVELGLGENAAQFTLLVAVNALVGAMVGVERSTLPLIGADEFGVGSTVAVLSFIVAFGLAKSLTNLAAGALADRVGRRRLLIAGWAVALPVPLLIAVAPSWGWVVAANLFLGVNQGLAWSMTVLMKIDLVGPKRRGLALGLNEAAGYGGVALAAAASGWLAGEFLARDVLVIAAFGVAVRPWRSASCSSGTPALMSPSNRPATIPAPTAARHDCAMPSSATSFRNPGLRACSQAGLVNNLNDALAWGLVPLFLAADGASPGQIGMVAGIYPAVWGRGHRPFHGWLPGTESSGFPVSLKAPERRSAGQSATQKGSACPPWPPHRQSKIRSVQRSRFPRPSRYCQTTRVCSRPRSRTYSSVDWRLRMQTTSIN